MFARPNKHDVREPRCHSPAQPTPPQLANPPPSPARPAAGVVDRHRSPRRNRGEPAGATSPAADVQRLAPSHARRQLLPPPSSRGRRTSLQHAQPGSRARAAHVPIRALIGSTPVARNRTHSISRGVTRGLQCAAQKCRLAAWHLAARGCLSAWQLGHFARTSLRASVMHATVAHVIA